MDLFQDTSTEACNLPFEVVHVIAEVADVFAFAVAYDHPNVAVSDPMVLELVDLSLGELRETVCCLFLVLVKK